jgi:hypothetical protein
MRVVALVADLMDRSRISAVDPTVQFAREPGDCEGADVVVVDLGAYADDVAAARRAAPSARLVAFGRHDNAAALEQARADGADAALARSRFFRDPKAAWG